MTDSGQSLVVQRLLFLLNILYPLGNRTTRSFCLAHGAAM